MDLRFWRKKTITTGISEWKIARDGISEHEEALEKVEYVYDCIRTRAQKIASIPWAIYTNGHRNSKLESIIKNPNNRQTSTQFLESIVGWLDLRGICFIWMRDYPNLYILDSDQMWWTQKSTGEIIFRYGDQTYTEDDIKIIKNFTIYSRLHPLSTLGAAFGSVQIMENYEMALKKLMANGAYIPAVLTSKERFTVEQVKQIQEAWRQYTGISNAGKLPVIGGDIRLEKIGLTPADLDLLNREQITKDRIYSAFGVPKKDFQNLNRATAEVQQEFFIRTTIIPFADSIAEQVTKFVLENKGEFKFEYKELPEMQGDLLTKAQVEEIHIRSGIKTINEVRNSYGLNPVPWGNDYWANMSLVSFGNYTEQTETLRALKEEIKHLKESIEKKSVKNFEKNKEIRWKLFIARTTPQEQRLVKEINKFFKKLKNDVLKQLQGYKAVQKFNIEDVVNVHIPEEAKENLINLLKPYLLTFMQQAGDATMAEYDFGISFNLQIPEIQKWLQWKLENSASEVIKTTQADLYNLLLDGVNDGLSIPDLADKIEHLFEETYKHRAETIARTEVIAANNKASLEGLKQAGVKTKTWLTAIDERTREWHVEADGQTVGIDEPFIVNNEELDFPGDPKGSPENIINCRCTVVWNGEE